MERDYIAKVLFNPVTKSIIMIQDKKVIGGVSFRPFLEQKFAEIVFLAVSSKSQNKGLGRTILAHLKTYCRSELQIFDLLTYADNKATGFFQKQGFSNRIRIDPKRWKGYIKDYELSTLMHCVIYPKVDYLKLNETIEQQKQNLYHLIQVISNRQIFYSGLCFSEEVKEIPFDKIPGIDKEFATQIKNQYSLQLKPSLKELVDYLKNHPSIWPFLQPVDPHFAPDYDKVVKNPIDLSIIEKKVENLEYFDQIHFIEDIELMCRNCFLYNNKETVFYQSGQAILIAFRKKVKSMKKAKKLL
ncbi:hypothetical protein M0811_14603 [Anaeramoeba ignava]|uniref:Histone acetyltransferase n=1 Tax=Anaeramoeba ignava TaxID=1746090 RepID=A0A9Q0LU82_ANAIG|nr:hypothetical protein M0811_14603 [Anaeramoeba ignava]